AVSTPVRHPSPPLLPPPPPPWMRGGEEEEENWSRTGKKRTRKRRWRRAHPSAVHGEGWERRTREDAPPGPSPSTSPFFSRAHHPRRKRNDGGYEIVTSVLSHTSPCPRCLAERGSVRASERVS